MAGNLSDGTTTIMSNLSIGGLDSNGALFGRLSVKEISALSGLNTSSFTASAGISTSALTATSRITTPTLNISSGAILSTASADFRTNSVILSVITAADSSGMTTGQIRFVFAASGMSLMFSSGKTVYTIGASAVSAVQG